MTKRVLVVLDLGESSPSIARAYVDVATRAVGEAGGFPHVAAYVVYDEPGERVLNALMPVTGRRGGDRAAEDDDA